MPRSFVQEDNMPNKHAIARKARGAARKSHQGPPDICASGLAAVQHRLQATGYRHQRSFVDSFILVSAFVAAVLFTALRLIGSPDYSPAAPSGRMLTKKSPFRNRPFASPAPHRNTAANPEYPITPILVHLLAQIPPTCSCPSAASCSLSRLHFSASGNITPHHTTPHFPLLGHECPQLPSRGLTSACRPSQSAKPAAFCRQHKRTTSVTIQALRINTILWRKSQLSNTPPPYRYLLRRREQDLTRACCCRRCRKDCTYRNCLQPLPYLRPRP